MNDLVTVVGAGLAGSEAAYQLSKRGVRVRLIDMKPVKYSPAHTMEGFAELVCSNSLKGMKADTAAGMQKRELEVLGSRLYAEALRTRVPAGGALAGPGGSHVASLGLDVFAHDPVQKQADHQTRGHQPQQP